ncbi:MAG: ATP-binding cassette domain-containing protein [Deltaproteobacteria bacterium]|nr:ATP-binding cassette domain-containing protein [Deltaproteobacteria bacterium]
MSTLIEVKDLKMYFPLGRAGLFSRKKAFLRAVDGVSFKIHKGETLGLVGESGSGKTTLGRAILRLIEPTGGRIIFKNGNGEIDIATLSRNQLRRQWRHMQMIFQDPYASLNPRMTVKEIIGESLVANRLASGEEMDERIVDIARLCGLNIRHLSRYPHAFSGGQRQRIAIARALVMHPQFIVCDEPVSALDVSIQAQILNLLKDLQQELGLTYLFIAHDLSAVAYACDRVAVMYLGRLVEMATTKELYYTPKHPYIEALMSAIPPDDPELPMQPVFLEGEQPNPANPPSGCTFHPRCRYADNGRCKSEVPGFREVSPGRFISCHHAESLSLKGALEHQIAVGSESAENKQQIDDMHKK